MSGVPTIQRHCERCIYRDRNNDTIVCALPRCALRLNKNGEIIDKLTGRTVQSIKRKSNG